MAIIISGTSKRVFANYGFSDTSNTTSITDRWSIVMSSQTTDPNSIKVATDLPQSGEFYKDDTNAENENLTVTSRQFTLKDESPYQYWCDITYDIPQVSLNLEEPRLIAFESGSVPYQETIDNCYHIETISKTGTPTQPNWNDISEGIDNTPIDNTAKDLILGVVATRFNKQIAFTQAEDLAFNSDSAQELIGTTNRKTITIAGVKIKAGEGLITGLTSTLQNPNAVEGLSYPNGKYWQTNYVIQIQKGGWYTKVINSGLNQLTAGVLVTIKYADLAAGGADDAITEPQKLNATGVVIQTASTDVFYRIIWNIYPKDWASVIEFVQTR